MIDVRAFANCDLCVSDRSTLGFSISGIEESLKRLVGCEWRRYSRPGVEAGFLFTDAMHALKEERGIAWLG